MAPADSCKQAEVRTLCWLAWYADEPFQVFCHSEAVLRNDEKCKKLAAIGGALDLFLLVFCSKGCIINFFLPTVA